MTTVLQLDEIRQLVDVPQLIEELERGFVLYSDGKVNVPPVGFLNFDDPPGDVHIKYGYVLNDDYYVLKMASGFYDNPTLGLPASDGLILVFSQKTGELKLILLDKCWLTDQRTAAAGAVAAKHLAPQEIRGIGIVGTGVQARLQLEMLRNVVDCSRCLIWGRNAEKVQQMVDELRASEYYRDWGLDIESAGSVDDLTRECNLIVTTTSARSPLIRADQVQKGTLGADVLGQADLVVADSISQCVDHGECHFGVKQGTLDESGIVELGKVIKDPAAGRSSNTQITIADLTGVAIQDIQIAKLVDRALSGRLSGT
jgi:ornithine cyclodeaminase